MSQEIASRWFSNEAKLPPKDKQSTCSSQDIAHGWVSTEVDYTSPIYDQPTNMDLKNGKITKISHLKYREEIIMKHEMKV